MTTMTHAHAPVETPVDRLGIERRRADVEHYPLFSRCACGALIARADGSADWAVRDDGHLLLAHLHAIGNFDDGFSLRVTGEDEQSTTFDAVQHALRWLMRRRLEAIRRDHGDDLVVDSTTGLISWWLDRLEVEGRDATFTATPNERRKLVDLLGVFLDTDPGRISAEMVKSAIESITPIERRSPGPPLHVITERADGPDLDDLVRLIRYLRVHGIAHRLGGPFGDGPPLSVDWLSPNTKRWVLVEGLPESEAHFVGPDGTVYDIERNPL